ncbi:hypothetical protein C8R46DRAFT_1192145 [Mycena filopes]|nr:hypothetical protein C8R46DRAFT_1192145 [Mycena filopes]
MPRPHTAAKTRVDNITAYLTPALTLLDELNDAFGLPYVQPIIKTTQALIVGVQNVKRNKDECFQLVENIHRVLYPIIRLHLKSETLGTPHLAVFEAIGAFTETLHKMYMFIQMQQDGSKIKQFFHQAEANKLLKDCQAGLDQAIEVFKSENANNLQGGIGVTVLSDVMQVQAEADNMHKKLLELILTESTLSDTGTTSDQFSLVLYKMSNSSQNSSNSFSMLPSKPKIFHGREAELQHILEVLGQQAPRIAILGGGGMGKTSLARAALHHSETCSKFQSRFFVSAEAATTAVELAALIGLHLGLDPGSNLIKPVVYYFAQQTSPCLLVLDNLETPWEPLQSRRAVEDLISLLTDDFPLAMLSSVLTTRQITMRGAERPGKVQWTRPFLQPLEPLSDHAALQIFEDITDDPDLTDEKHELLQFTGNMPLALDLMAHLVEYEGLLNVLTRWKTERTSLLSIGYDRSSNMDTSIALSLASPRITPQSRELLSLLSILPDGLSDIELVQSNLQIKDVLSCKSALIATSLAYRDSKGRLRSLVPIREHVRRFSPPPDALVQALRKLFHNLLVLYHKYNDWRLSGVLAQITTNLANLDEVLQWGLQPQSLDLAETIESITSLNSFYRVTRAGRTHLLNDIPIHLCGPRQRVLHINECLGGLPGGIQTQKLLAEGISQFEHIEDPILECKLYRAASRPCGISGLWIQELQLLEKALALSKSTGDDATQSYCLSEIAWFKCRSGDYTAALALGRHANQLAYQATNLEAASRAMETCTTALTFLGDYPRAMTEIDKAKELLILCGMTSSNLHYGFLNLQAEIHLCKSEYVAARSIHAANLQDFGLDPSSYRYVITLLNIAHIDMIIGTRKELVQQRLETAYKICVSTHFLRGVTLCDLLLGQLDLREGNLTSARALLQDCLKSNLGKDNDVTISCLEQLADVTQWPTKFDGLSRWPVLYLSQAHKTKERLGVSKALLFTADLFMEDDEVTAQNLLIVALEEFTFMDVHRSRAQCMMRLGDLAQRKGKTTEAAELWKSARPLFERSLQAKDVACIDRKLGALEQESLAKLTTLHAPMSLLLAQSSQGKSDQEDYNAPEETDGPKAMLM